MKSRTVMLSLSPPDGAPAREFGTGDDTVTMYARYENREVVVMPDVRGFHLHIKKPGDLEGPIVCLSVEEDGAIRIWWNQGGGDFEVQKLKEFQRVLVTPIPGKEKP